MRKKTSEISLAILLENLKKKKKKKTYIESKILLCIYSK